MTWRPDGTMADPHGVVADGRIGHSVIDRDAPAAVEAAVSALSTRLSQSVPSSSFKCWWTYSNPYADGPFCVAVAVDPASDHATRAEQLIHQLPETWQGYDLFFVAWPYDQGN
jgi:hypothetical protein